MKILSRLFRAFFLLALLGVLLCAGVGIYLHLHPELAKNAVEKAVNTLLPGDVFSAESISPLLWPKPGVKVTGLLLRTPKGTLYADEIECRLSWFKVIRGDASPEELRFVRPVVLAHLPEAPGRPGLPADWPGRLAGLRIIINDGTLALYPSAGTGQSAVSAEAAPPPPGASRQASPVKTAGRTEKSAVSSPGRDAKPLLLLSGATLDARLPGIIRAGQLDVFIKKARQQWTGRHAGFSIPHQLRALSVHADGLRAGPQESLLPLLLSNARVSVTAEDDPAWRETTALLTLSLARKTLRGELHLGGNIRLNRLFSPSSQATEPDVPLRLALPFSAPLPDTASHLPESFHIAGSSLRLGDDALSFDGAWTPGEKLDGKAVVGHLSLPRWFSFARGLPNGLASALGNLSGSLAFTLTEKRLDVPDLTATVAGIPLKGSGGVSDFSAPVIAIDVSAAKADLNRVLPELTGIAVPAPTYAGPVIDFGETAGRAPGYDIKIRAGQASFWKLASGELSLRIAPGRKASLLTAKSPLFYGGSMRLGMEFSSPCAIDAAVKGASLPKLARAFGSTIPVSGSVSADAAMTAPLGRMGRFLTSLNGKINAEVAQGALHIGGKKTPFRKLGFNFAGKCISEASDALPPLTMWNGKWRYSIDMDDPAFTGKPLELNLALDGPLTVSSANALPVRAEAVPAVLTGQRFGLPLHLTGILSCSVPEQSIAVSRLNGTAGELELNGDFSGSFSSAVPDWTGKGRISCARPRDLLARFGLLPERLPQKALHSVSANGSIGIHGPALRLNIENAKIDTTDLTGEVSRDGKGAWKTSLHLGSINLDQYLPRTQRSQKTQPAPIPSGWMRSVRAEGVLHADAVTLAGILQKDLTVPFTLKEGLLSVSPVTSTCLGGSQHASLQARPLDGTDKGINVAFDYSLRDASMEELTRATASGALLRGKGTLLASAKGNVHAMQTFLHELDGTWSYSMGPGSYIQTDTLGKIMRQRYALNGITASGALRHGIITCDDLLITGPRLTARGKGNINLVRNTINYRLTASIPGLPDIPITYTGSLSDPTRNISLLNVFTNFLGNIGKGLFSFIGDIITSPLQLFR